MIINSRAWNPSDQKTMHQIKCFELEHYRDPVNAADHAIDSAETALKIGGCKPDIITTITLPLDEYRLLISDAQKKAKEEGCKEGSKEAWDLAQRINLLPDIKKGAYGIDDLGEAFGTCDWSKVLLMPVDEVLAKDKEYQKEKKTLHVGDEVEFDTKLGFASEKYRGYVTDLVSPVIVRILTKKYGTFTVSPEKCIKTGKHNPDVEKVMASFEEEEGE